VATYLPAKAASNSTIPMMTSRPTTGPLPTACGEMKVKGWRAGRYPRMAQFPATIVRLRSGTGQVTGADAPIAGLLSAGMKGSIGEFELSVLRARMLVT
jgi:hypothetical protein